MKKLVSLLLALALLLGMASALAETEGKNVYIVTPYLTSVTTKDMAEYIKGNLEEVGCKVTVIDTEGDTATFASRIEDAVTAKADAIVIISVDPEYCKVQIQEAYEAGIPVFGCDAGYIDTMQMNATSDNYQIGQLITTYLFDKMDHKGNLVVLTHRPHPGVVRRTEALDDMLKDNPDIHVLTEEHVEVPGPIESGKSLMESIILANPEPGSITAVWCGFDEPAIGAAQALQEAGRTDVIVTGVDANEQAVAMIQAGNTALVATVRQDFVGMAKIVTEEMIKVFNGEETTRGDFYAEAVIVDK